MTLKQQPIPPRQYFTFIKPILLLLRFYGGWKLEKTQFEKKLGVKSKLNFYINPNLDIIIEKA